MRNFAAVVLVGVSAVLVPLSADEKKDDPRIALDEVFPDPGSAKYFGGEITLVEHVNRRGILRLDRDGTINKYFWDLPHEFRMLPYGAIYMNGAPAELRDVPIGTHLHGEFYLGPEGDFEVTPPESGYASGNMPRPDLRSVESKYSRVFLLEDDFTFYRRNGSGWKVKEIVDGKNQIVVERVSLETGEVQAGVLKGMVGEATIRLNEGTRCWKGSGYAEIDDLAVGQVVQMNLGWVSLLGTQKQDALARDIWIDEASCQQAEKIQRGRYLAHAKLRGVGAKVMKTEHTPGKGAEGDVTIQLHAGIATELIEELAATKRIVVRAAEPSLRIYDINDKKPATIVEVKRIGNPPTGSSGLEIRFHIYEMFEGLRKGRTIRVANESWDIPVAPREEKLWPNDIRIFEVGPPYINWRDGPPPGVDEEKK
ncbi:MAG: hypothetical protein P1U86_07185 [Verrucomicrobiales bacterium]|nr:hypothetical protein [Verrucomicrobiales bacterium]